MLFSAYLQNAMTNTLTVIGNYLFGWTVISLAVSWCLALVYPLMLRSMAESSAERASFFTLIYSLLAPLSAVFALIILSLPELAFPFISEHCHDAICSPHTLHMTTDTVEGVLAVFVVVLMLSGFVVLMARQLHRSRRHVKTLSSLSEPGSASYLVVESPHHMAWCAGFLKPQVFLSSGLVDVMDARQLRLILAHEQTHAFRRDNLRKWVLQWVTIAWPRGRKQRIRQNFSNYSEHICDLVAARCEKGVTELAQVIETLATCNGDASKPMNSLNHHRQQRIAALQRELHLQQGEGKQSYVKPAAFVACSWLIATMSAIHFGHPLLECLSR
jgi:beta-lactamase regulating signal transducer with metallopeptidase domain